MPIKLIKKLKIDHLFFCSLFHKKNTKLLQKLTKKFNYNDLYNLKTVGVFF